MFRRRPGRLLNVLCTFNLCPVSTGFSEIGLPLWFPLAGKKSPNKRILFQVDRKSVSTSRNGEFAEEYVSARRKILFTLAGISEKSKKIVANSSDKSFK